MWRRGRELYAEVALPDGVGGDGYWLHPALLDAAWHTLEYAEPDREIDRDQVRLPFALSGVRLHAVDARVLRVRLAATGPDIYEFTLCDPDGQPVCTIESLTLRPVARDRLLAVSAGPPMRCLPPTGSRFRSRPRRARRPTGPNGTRWPNPALPVPRYCGARQPMSRPGRNSRSVRGRRSARSSTRPSAG